MEPYIVLAILAGTLILCMLNYWRYDVVAWTALLTAVLTGVVPVSKAFDGFSNPAVITVAFIMIITHALIQSGFVSRAVNLISPITSKSLTAHLFILTTAAAVLSGFMNNVGALALLLPLTLQTAYEAKRSPSLLLMPVAFASLMGGLTTLIGTPPNIIIASFREEALGEAYSMFDYTPVGAGVTAVGLLFLIFIAPRFLPIRRKVSQANQGLFQVRNYLTEVKVPEHSPVVGRTRRELENWIEGEVLVIGRFDGEGNLRIMQGRGKFQPNDLVLLEASHDDTRELVQSAKLEIGDTDKFSEESLKGKETGVLEAVVPQNSHLEGHSARSLKLRSKYQINVLSVHCPGRKKDRMHDIRFRAGDVVLMHGDIQSLRDNAVDLGFLPLTERGIPMPPKHVTYVPIAALILAVLLTAAGVLPVQISFLVAVVVLLLTRTVSPLRVYDAIDFSVIVLLGALIPIGKALETTGGAALIADAVIAIGPYLDPYLVLALLMVITVVLSAVANNAATAVIMAPIAISIAHGLQISVDPLLMGTAVACTCSFLTPLSHQNNTLIMEPGGYHFRDFFKMGVPLEVIVLLVAVPLIPVIWPF